jgi:hypothetical protein
MVNFVWCSNILCINFSLSVRLGLRHFGFIINIFEVFENF